MGVSFTQLQRTTISTTIVLARWISASLDQVRVYSLEEYIHCVETSLLNSRAELYKFRIGQVIHLLYLLIRVWTKSMSFFFQMFWFQKQISGYIPRLNSIIPSLPP